MVHLEAILHSLFVLPSLFENGPTLSPVYPKLPLSHFGPTYVRLCWSSSLILSVFIQPTHINRQQTEYSYLHPSSTWHQFMLSSIELYSYVHFHVYDIQLHNPRSDHFYSPLLYFFSVLLFFRYGQHELRKCQVWQKNKNKIKIVIIKKVGCLKS